MKRNIFWIFIAVLSLLNTACMDDFGDMNDDPNKVPEIDPGYLLTRVWMRYNGSPHEEHRGNLLMSGPLSGIMSSSYFTGQGYNGNVDSYNEAKMLEMYNDAIRNGVEMLYILKEDQSQDNTAKYAIGTIVMQFAYQRITDLYGNIPYHEGGLGYREGILYPRYDSQEDIYKSSVDSLKKYRDVLLDTESSPFSTTNDIIFGGIGNGNERKEAWAKLANSLILRMGVRAVEGDANWAQQTVEEAANHQAGFITSVSNDDAAIMPTGLVGGDWGMIVNGAGSVLSGTGGRIFVGEEWLRMAQENRDPRIFYTTAQGYVDGSDLKAWTGQAHFNAFEQAARTGEPWKPVTFSTFKSGGGEDNFAARGLMLVHGKNEDGEDVLERVVGQWFINSDTTDVYNEYLTAAAINPETIGNREAPIVVFGGDESYYILAEAALRGWSVPGDANSNLQKAIEISLNKYPELFNFGTSASTYLGKQSAFEGQTLTYEALAQEYLDLVMTEDIDLELVWRERWKSYLTAQGAYEAYALWNRTNLEVVPVGLPRPGTNTMELPVYKAEDLVLEDLDFGVAVATSEYASVPFHNGGDTEGWRPRRINYPNAERTNNPDNVESAMEHQISEYGQVGSGSHFITTYMWISKKD
nr:SusD/RagB family nutrient-binding outer membrane lipoprotein [uncultured Carboxylicivirga sp.]